MESLKIQDVLKVLYVEDDAITRSWMSKFLKKNINKVFTAVNGKDGIEKFSENLPHIIVTDLIMPDMTGIDMVKQIRKNGHTSAVIITSGLSDSQTILESIDLRIDKYLVKPIDSEILLQAILDSGTKVLEQYKDIFVINKDLLLSKEKKDELELAIRNIYSKYLKDLFGKGAKTIQVYFTGKTIEILLKNGLTLMEENLLLAGEHENVIELSRRILYEDRKDYIEKELENLIGRKFKMDKVYISPRSKYEKITFILM